MITMKQVARLARLAAMYERAERLDDQSQRNYNKGTASGDDKGDRLQTAADKLSELADAALRVELLSLVNDNLALAGRPVKLPVPR